MTTHDKDKGRRDQPGRDQPDPDSKLHKGTKNDLEDQTGGPGQTSINPLDTGSSTSPPSINEPPGSAAEKGRK